MAAPIRILIVDDNQIVRRGVAALLSSEVDCQVCGEAINGADGLQKAQELRPDLVLVDISMPGIDGLETTRLLRKELPGVRVLILSQHDPAQVLPGALAAGADGCVDKSRLSADLAKAIENISASLERSPAKDS
jgi:two-component system, NarL family, response regulator NreC